MNRVYLLNASIFEEEKLFAKGMQMISSKRADKIRTLKNPSAARLSLGAGVLLSFVLKKYGLDDKLNEMQTGEYGKPFLPGVDFHFSISHSGEYVLCAVSDVQIGADLQKVKDKIPNHTKKIFSPAEAEYFSVLEDKEKTELFYRLWAKKESILKWDGRGLRLPLSEISLINEGYPCHDILHEGKKLHFHEYADLLPEYSICICSEQEGFPKHVEEITTEILTKY